MKNVTIKVADEVWIIVALLHREHAKRDDFTVSEIVARAEKEGITPRLRPGLRVHATQHCVADRPPNPGRYCMLTAVTTSRRRLFRPGDPVHPARRGAKQVPDPADIPEKYRPLVEWYEAEYVGRGGRGKGVRDPILELRGRGADLWAEEDADAYVDRLRSDWR